MTRSAERWMWLLGHRPVARAVWGLAARLRHARPMTIELGATGEAFEVDPDIRSMAWRFASPSLDEAKLVYLGTMLAASGPARGERVVAVAGPKVPLAALLRAYLAALGQHARVVTARPGDPAAAEGSRPGPLALLAIGPAATGAGLDADLARWAPQVKPGGFVVLLRRGRRHPTRPDALDTFLAAHPAFELVHESNFAVLRRLEEPARRARPLLPLLEVTVPPELAEFTVDNACLCLNLDQCNLRCIMCWTTHDRAANRRRYAVVDMPRDRLLALLAAPDLERTTLSVVGGGEPFLYPHLGDLLRAGPTDKRRLMIMTNGTLLHEHPEFWRVAAYAPITLTFSVDAATAGTYAKVRPPGPWDALVGNIERFVALRERNPLLQVQTSYVVLRQNLAEIGEFMRLNVRWGVRYVHFHPALAGAYPDEWRVDLFDREFVRTMAEAAEVARAHGIALDRPEQIVPAPFVAEGRIDPTPAEAASAPSGPDPSLPAGDPRRSCTLHSRAMTINHLGDVFVCDTAFRAGYRCGNVFRDGIRGAWLSPAWVSLRRAHQQGEPHRHPLCRGCLMVPEAFRALTAGPGVDLRSSARY